MKLFKTLLVGFATGAAATYFFKTKEGQQTKEKLVKAVDDYKANPEDYHQLLKEKATDYKEVAVATVQEYKEKFESGELTTDDLVKTLKEKAQEVADFASTKISEVTHQDTSLIIDADEVEEVGETGAEVDDIVLNYDEELVEDKKEILSEND